MCQVVLPLELGIKISEKDPVRKVVEICGDPDYRKLYAAYLRKWRKIDPAKLFEIVVLAYMQGKYSSREIENLCRNDIRFMWLLEGEEAPDHATIARFQNEKLVPVVEDLFYQSANKLVELGEISYNNVFIAGTKIEANENRYTFVWANAVKNNRRKLSIRLEKELPFIAEKYGINESCGLEEVLYALESYANMYGIQFVYGSGKRKTELQRDYGKLREYKIKLDGYQGRPYAKRSVEALLQRSDMCRKRIYYRIRSVSQSCRYDDVNTVFEESARRMQKENKKCYRRCGICK